MNASVTLKLNNLKKIIMPLKRAMVAFSGGTDSSLLLAVTQGVLPGNVLAVTALSPTYPKNELKVAKAIAEQLKVPHLLIETEETSIPSFVNNPPCRCLHCKTELFQKMDAIASQKGFSYILDGTNLDDLQDYRPGRQAAKEFNVVSPLAQAHLTKDEVRQLARELHLPNWNKPAQACLSSRIPYGDKITPEKLAQIETVESFLQGLGFLEVRLRHHGNLARIEITHEKFPLLMNNREQIVSFCQDQGFIYVTLDLAGFRSGSMNEALKKDGTEDA